MMMHMIILNYTSKNWRAHINYLETVVEDLVRCSSVQTTFLPNM
jgi:hypothetical protein